MVICWFGSLIFSRIKRTQLYSRDSFRVNTSRAHSCGSMVEWNLPEVIVNCNITLCLLLLNNYIYTHAPPLKHDQLSNWCTSLYEPLPTATGMFCSVQSQDVGGEDYFSLHRRVDRYWISRGVTKLGSWRGVGWCTTCPSQHENTGFGKGSDLISLKFFFRNLFFFKPHC